MLGGVTFSPLKQEVLEKLIRLEIDETQVKPEDYLPFKSGTTEDCYVIGIIAHPGITEQYYAGKVLYGALKYLIELLEKGVVIKRLYTVATTEDGDRLAQKLQFKPLPGEWEGQFEDFRRPYVLNLEAKESQSKLINRYLQQKKNLARRRKRYEKQAVKQH